MDSAQLQVVELGRLSMRDWAQLVGSEPEPFGGVCAGFEFRPKDHHVGIRDGDGTLLAAGGWTVVELEVEGYGCFEVVGVGALIVRRDQRGSGLSTQVMQRLREVHTGSGLRHRLLLCEPHLVPLYARRDYRLIEDPVDVMQESGAVRWPLEAMWRPLVPGAIWPRGAVRIAGPPF